MLLAHPYLRPEYATETKEKACKVCRIRDKKMAKLATKRQVSTMQAKEKRLSRLNEDEQNQET